MTHEKSSMRRASLLAGLVAAALAAALPGLAGHGGRSEPADVVAMQLG